MIEPFYPADGQRFRFKGTLFKVTGTWWNQGKRKSVMIQNVKTKKEKELNIEKWLELEENIKFVK